LAQAGLSDRKHCQQRVPQKLARNEERRTSDCIRGRQLDEYLCQPTQ